MWARSHNILIGLWLMSSPWIFPEAYGAHVSINNHIVGPIVLSCAIIALHEALRSLRWVNAVIGAWLLIAPWVLGYGTLATVNSSISGFLLLIAATARGRTFMTFDGGWRALWPRASLTGGHSPRVGA